MLSTERKPKEDRRRHECPCGARWTSVARIERDSISTPPGNTGQTPPVMGVQTPGNTGSTGALYSDSGIFPVRSDSNPKASLSPERERARSNQGADFNGLLAMFCQRWERSNRRPYPVTAADRNQLGRFMRNNGNYIEGFAAMCDRYLSDRAAFLISKSGNHRLAWLVTNGLAQFGGVPRETVEQYSARLRREHEARKAASRRPPADPAVRDLIAELAKKAAVG